MKKMRQALALLLSVAMLTAEMQEIAAIRNKAAVQRTTAETPRMAGTKFRLPELMIPLLLVPGILKAYSALISTPVLMIIR